MNEPASTQTSSTESNPVRSTQGVLVVIGLLLLVPLVALVVVLLPGASGGGNDIVESVDADRIQAVYLTNDLVYFGVVGESHGEFFELNDAFYLRRSAEAETEGSDAAEPTLVPVPVSEEVDGTGNLLVNAREVLRIQSLDDDSEIAKIVGSSGS
jgi:hypothetical protein